MLKHRIKILYLFSLKVRCSLKDFPRAQQKEFSFYLTRLFKKYDLWLLLHCWNLNFHVVCPAYFFFSCKFPVKTANGHLIKGQPSFLLLFGKQTNKQTLFHLWLSGQFEKVLPNREITDVFLPGLLYSFSTSFFFF